MNYKQYLDLQNRVEWLYDFHPEFFGGLTTADREILQKTFLYDTRDEDYPESLEEFFNQSIANEANLQNEIIEAVKKLYEVSGSGELEVDYQITDIYHAENVTRDDLIDEIKRLARNYEPNQETAYKLAGLMSLDFVRGLNRNDAIVEVLQMAGQLELPKEHQGKDASWDVLIDKINTLK